MTPTDLDTLIAKLKGPDAVTVQDIEPKTLAAGLEDLKNRMSHVEHSHLKVLADSRAKSDRLDKVETVVGSLEHDRNEMQKTVKTSTDLPIANAKRVDELEARVRSCEGAVGAAPYKEPKKIEPAKTESPKPVTPEPQKAAEKPANWNPFSTQPAAPVPTPPVNVAGHPDPSYG